MTNELPVIQTGAAIQTGTRCRSLLSKGLYINHGLPPGKEVAGDGNFWCGKTQRIYGPDQKLCDLDVCCNPARSCYDE